MPQNNGKQTIIFDKNIKGKRESAPVDEQKSVAAKPESDNIKTSEPNRTGKFVELTIISIIVLFSLCVASYTLLDALHIINPQGKTAQLVSGISTNSTSSTPASATSKTTTSASASTKSTTSNAVTAKTSSTSSSSGSVTTPDPGPLSGGITTTKTTYIYRATRGQGVTHLARQAMLAYTTEHGITLTRQQKLYFETNLTQLSNPVHLNIGDAREFSATTLEGLARRALAQTAAQQVKWNKYLKRYPL